MELGILNIGYADGYLRGFSNSGAVMVEGVRLPVVGRVSMDLLIIDLTAMPELEEGDWVTLDYEIGRASCRERVCQYVSISVVAGSLKKKKEEISRKV